MANLFPYLITCVLLTIFFVGQRLLRPDTNAKTMAKSAHDKNSTLFLSILVVLNSLVILIAPSLTNNHVIHIYAPAVAWIGVIIMGIGLSLRLGAAYTLGKSYTTTLREDDNHKLITDGLYRKIRHPGYLGTLLLFVGGGLAVLSWLSLLVSLLLVIAYIYRMRTEETMLSAVFGQEYKKYMRKSFRLIPYIY